ETKQEILDGTADGRLVYEPGQAPIEVVIYNPLEVKNGSFLLRFVDENAEGGRLSPQARWQLENLDDPSEIILSDHSIASLNEQLIGKYGFSILLGQVDEPGTIQEENRGAIGSSIRFKTGNNEWLRFVRNRTQPFLTFVHNALNEVDFDLDPTQVFSDE